MSLVLMAGMTLTVVDVKGAFIHGDIEDGEEIDMEVPRGSEKYYDYGVVLRLRRCLYRLKHAAMALCKQFLNCMEDMNM